MGAENSVDRRRFAFVFLLIAVLFAQSRWFVLGLRPGASDVPWYARYARSWAGASQQDTSFYDHQALEARHEIDQARAAGVEGQSLEEYGVVEYPPLAILLLQVPRLWMAPLDEGTSFTEEYVGAFRWGMAVVDLATFFLVLWLVRQLGARETVGATMGRLLTFLLGTLALLPFLYDRLDLLQAGLVALALVLLTTRLPYGWFFGVLAAAVHFKLVPIVLAPVFLIGSLPVALAREPLRFRCLAALALRGAFLIGLIGMGFLAFRVALGPRCLEFLGYHGERGLEIASFAGSTLLALRPFGVDADLFFSHCSVCIRSAPVPGLAASLTGVALVCFTILSLFLLFHARRLAARAAVHEAKGGSLARIFPQTFAAYCLLFLMTFIVTNKVFSPQYLLWLAPLAPLVPFQGWRRNLFLATFVATCVLSSAFLVLLGSDVVQPMVPGQTLGWIVREPTTRFVVLVLIRNLLLASLLGALLVRLIRDAFQAPVETESPFSLEARNASGPFTPIGLGSALAHPLTRSS
jgi:hypothetical protein